MLRCFCYRLYPTPAQDAALRQTMEQLRELYNAALQERRDAYRKQRMRVATKMQEHQRKALRDVRPDSDGIHMHLLQDVVKRVERAQKAFFRRAKAGEKPGYPRFNRQGRYRTSTFKDCKTKKHWLVSGGRRLELHGVGKVKIKLHRPLEGSLQQVRVTLGSDDHWYAGLVCRDVPRKVLPSTGQHVGVDVDITTFAALSTGENVESPRPYRADQRRLQTAQRRVSRRKRRCKSVGLLAPSEPRGLFLAR